MIATGFMSSNSRTWPRLCEKTNHVFARRRSEQNNHVFARRRSEQNNHVIARRRSEQNNHVFARRRSRQSNLMTTTIDKLIRWSCITALAFTLSACEINEEPLAAADQTAGTSGGGTPPPPGGTPPPPSATDQAIFESTLYPLLVDANNFCVGCHGATRDPLFAVADASVAYNAVVSQQKVNLVNPALSRIYLRPFEDRHNCGGDVSCDRIAADFLTAIQAWANQAVSSLPPPGTIGQVVVSNMSNFGQAMDGGAARADGSAIALFDFAEGSGDVTMDTSGIGTPITLQIEGMEWVEGGGLRNVSGKAQASLADSRKLFDLITPVNEYSVEAWLIPDNNAQDGPARIVSYSQDTAVRNFTLGQNAIYYQLRNRSDTTGANGTPELEALDPQVDTVLQHVVMTFDAQTGRKVYINGQLSIEENLNTDSLAWQDDQLLVLGNEVTDNRLWQGVLKLVAIHNKALSGVEVKQNFDAGTGTMVTIRFDVSDAIGQPASIDMQAMQIDAAAYLFAQPVFVSDAVGIAVRNIRIAVNGVVPVAAQPFRRIDTLVMQTGTELSPLGAVIPVQLGPDNDMFHLEFEVLGNQFGLAELVPPSSPPAPVPDVAEPDLGLRMFSQINDTMASLTGIDANQNVVLAAYSELSGSLPPAADLNSFAAAQQIAIQRLATDYCGAVVNDANNCDNFFGACSIDGNAKDQVATTLYDRFIGDNLANQPARADVTLELVRMIDDLGCPNGCNGATAETALQATCTAVLSSAAVTVN